MTPSADITPTPLPMPLYETAARDLLARYGSHTLAVVDAAITQLEENGAQSDLAVWRELRLALLRTAPCILSDTFH